MSGLPKANARRQPGVSENKSINRHPNPTERRVDMQACKQLFAVLEANRLRDADQLADELRKASDEREKKAIRLQICQAWRMFQAFAKPQSVEIVRALRQ